ncbi:MAG: nodulation protein NfeD [Acidobacteria bacterium]|nr:nodulation protein NfeD [Acidobacteriota bacterium]
MSGANASPIGRSHQAMKQVCILTLLVLVFSGNGSAQGPTVVQINLDDIVHPVSAEYIQEGLNHAKELGARAVVLRLDTPGGLADSTREIVQAILTSPVPVITWVGPNGARAASAGFFILLAGDVALMAPGTNSGAAHPVSITGTKIDEVMEKKIVSDSAAYIRSYVAKRGRNAQLAEQGVVESRSFTAEEALKENLIDAVVTDIPGIIERYHGKEIRRFDDSMTTLNLQGSAIDVWEMNARQRLLSRVLNPNIALILMLFGLLGLYVEITHPGLILPGVVGAISLILALFAFNVLPVNWTGAALILLAIALFVLEATVTSHGILALGGIVAMVVGALMLVEGPIPQLRIHFATTLAVAIPLAFITVFLVRLVYLSHQRKSTTGEEGMIGKLGVAKTDIHNSGKVLVHGEYWNAYSQTPIPAGANVRVVKLQGLKLEVEPWTNSH